LDVPAYLERIEYDGSLEPDLDTLRALHRRHMLTVPFENLAIHLQQPISLGAEALFEKIVVRRRGGFCYELNAAFAALLRGLGYQVAYLSARVAREGGGYSPEFDHLALLVNLMGAGQGRTGDRIFGSGPDRWLADVGFGDSFLEPLRLDEPGVQEEAGGAYRIEAEGIHHIVWQRQGNGQWQRLYCFTLQPRRLQDFAGMCRYHQTSPESGFTQRRICTQATPSGRITLSDTRFITTDHGKKVEQPVTGELQFRNLLKERFGLPLIS
jgi:N-hydroxyarylamine O-acetyltransferase